jgi:hypothetical protein
MTALPDPGTAAVALPTVRPPAPLRPVGPCDTLGALAAEVLAAGPSGHRAAPALALSGDLIEHYPAIPLPGVHVRMLDERLPGLLASASDADVAALVAVAATLSQRLSQEVRLPLHQIARRPEDQLSLAAHVATLLVEGMSPSETHLTDLATMAGPDAAASMTRRRSRRARAMALVHALARAWTAHHPPGDSETGRGSGPPSPVAEPDAEAVLSGTRHLPPYR